MRQHVADGSFAKGRGRAGETHGLDPPWFALGERAAFTPVPDRREKQESFRFFAAVIDGEGVLIRCRIAA
jgi:hypothetical protein